MRIMITHADGSVELRDPRTLDQAREEAVLRLRAAYDVELAKGWLHAPSGKLMQVDEASQLRMTSAAAMAQAGTLPPGFAWRALDNSAVPVTPAQMIALASGAGAHVYQLRQALWAALVAARAAATNEAADQVGL
jgi:hypothetical protein